MPDLDKAITFIQKNANDVEIARLEFILTGEGPSEEIVALLFSRQRADGGWAPFWASDYSSLDATCFRLAQAEQLGIESIEKAVLHAVQFLAQRQATDGSWEEDLSVIDSAPVWAAPGDLNARLYLTANCGYWLSVLGDLPEKASAAAGYLIAQVDEDGHLPGFLHTHWLAGGLFYHLEWKEPAEASFTYLRSRINDLGASNLAWLLIVAIKAGIPTDHHLLVQAAERLEQYQAEDGRWSSEDGPDYDVHATLEAVRALYLCGRLEL
jgi:squalene cyclase